jgi:hypothetical protein
LFKGEVRFAIPYPLPDDHMIKEVNLEQQSGGPQLLGEAGIRVRGMWIPGWMIVDQDESVRRMADNRFQDFARVRQRLVESAYRNLDLL